MSQSTGSNSEPSDPSAPVVGSFAVTLSAATSTREAFSSVLGSVRDAAMPEAMEWQIAATENGCELRIPTIPFCDPSCGTQAVCVADDDCVPYPSALDVGTVRVIGLGAAPFEMQPVSTSYQQPTDLHLDHPPSPEGATIRLEASGGDQDPFTIESTGIAPLVLAGPEVIVLDGTEPLSLNWEPPQDEEASRIEIKIDISHHGGLKGEIDCDIADDGEVEIPASMIQDLIELGTAGFPSITVTRVAKGTTNIPPGRVILRIISGVERFFKIPGITSCNNEDECGAGQMCAPDRTCQ